MLRLDALKIKRALSNIVSNAIEAPGEKAISLRLKIQDNEGMLTKIVLGNIGGKAISEEKITQIFKLFYTSDKQNGRGLGLTIAKRLLMITPARSGVSQMVSRLMVNKSKDAFRETCGDSH